MNPLGRKQISQWLVFECRYMDYVFGNETEARTFSKVHGWEVTTRYMAVDLFDISNFMVELTAGMCRLIMLKK